MTDAAEWCDTFGCENTPVKGGYCAECADISPKILDDPENAGVAVNPAGRTPEHTGTPDTPKESVVEGQSRDAKGGCEPGESVSLDRPAWRSCFADAVRYFNRQIDHRIHDHTDDGKHPDRPTTARDYFHAREWSDETIEEYLLGYAPADRELLDHLRAKGYDRETILATGLFTVFNDDEDAATRGEGRISQLWAGRYVLPYFDADGEPVYAISRATGKVGGGKAGYDGHPRDFISGKYGKLAHSKEYARVDEPIFGLDTVRDGEPLLVAGGIADAITLHQAGYPCISPVTTVRFKGDHEQAVVELVEERDIPTVYIVNDNERPSVDEKEIDGEAERIRDVLTIEQYGEGLRGAFGDADFLLDAGIDTRLVELPRAGRSLRKTDPDDYVRDKWGTLDTVLAAAKPAEQHPGYDREERAMQTAASGLERERERSAVSSGSGAVKKSGDYSALFDLGIREVTGRSWNDRGVNPLGHHGESENYYVLVKEYGIGYDYKYKVGYNPLTYLLVEAGERRAESPNGKLDDDEILAAWRQAKENRHIPDDDPIPRRALRYVALSRGLCEGDDIEDGWKLPAMAYNAALDAVEGEYGLDPGRRPIRGGGEGEDGPVEPIPTIPFAMLSRPRDELVRYARKRGLEWPDTDEARDRLGEALREAFREKGCTVLDAPTGLGKTHEASTTFWRELRDATDDQPVVLFASTTDARNEARDMARDAGLDVKVLLGRDEACPVCAGEFDPENCDDALVGEVVNVSDGEVNGVDTTPRGTDYTLTVEYEHPDTGRTETAIQNVTEEFAVGDDYTLAEAEQPVYIEGKLASAWMADKCDRRGLAVSTAHSEAKDLAAQGYVAHDRDASENGTGSAAVPCCPGEMKCRTAAQWPGEAGWCDDDGVPRYDLIVATDPFAYVPKLRSSKNIISDEQPDYTANLGVDDSASDEKKQQRIEAAVTAFLQYADAPAQANTYGGLVHVGTHGFAHNEHARPDEQPTMDERYEALRDTLGERPERDWYLHADGAHTLAPALARSIYYAARKDPDANGRRKATVPHEPPRLDANAGDEEGFNRTWVTVVLNDENEVETIRDAPDFSVARSVVGLDARPNPWLWQRNIHPDMTVERVLGTDERALWRRLEQETTIVQVGDATRPPGKDGENFTRSHAEAVIEQLRAEFGDDFQAAGTASAVEGRLCDLLRKHGVENPEETVMHFGEEKSRNDFADEVVGLVYGCIDPGDDYILNLAAECDLDIQPTMHECPECEGAGCGPANDHCHDGLCRDRGREFTGADADHGAALLASVRENHVAQMAGRFGRNLPDGQQSVVFVATDAAPPGFVDYKVPGVLWTARPNQKQRALVEYLRRRTGDPDEPVTAKGASEAVGCSKKHAIEVFRQLVAQNKATVRNGKGPHGADVWRWRPGAAASATPFSHVDLAPEDVVTSDGETVTSDVWTTKTWEVTMCPEELASMGVSPSIDSLGGLSSTTLGQFGGSKGTDPPPERLD